MSYALSADGTGRRCLRFAFASLLLPSVVFESGCGSLTVPTHGRTELPATTAGPDLTAGQLIALRFAADAELPELVREIAAGKLNTPKEIKTRVRDWQGDFLRV